MSEILSHTSYSGAQVKEGAEGQAPHQHFLAKPCSKFLPYISMQMNLLGIVMMIFIFIAGEFVSHFNDCNENCLESLSSNKACTVRPRDTQPQAAQTLQVHVFELVPKIFELNGFM